MDKKYFYKLKLTDEQLADPKFLLSLYKSNINMVNFVIPNPKNKALQDNIDFMIKYVKFKHSKEMIDYPQSDDYRSQTILARITEKYDIAMANPKFIVRLAKVFPKNQIIPLIKNALLPCRWFGKDKKELEALDQERYRECLSNLPVELLCDQVRKFSEHALKEIPNEIPNFNQVVSVGIEINGFRSLKRLDITQVLDNIDLIIKAYEKDGIRLLCEYIQHFLSPIRTHDCMCHGDEHYDKRYEEVQETLLASPEIQTVLKKEKLIVKKKEVKTTHFSIESCAIEEDGLSK